MMELNVFSLVNIAADVEGVLSRLAALSYHLSTLNALAAHVLPDCLAGVTESQYVAAAFASLRDHADFPGSPTRSTQHSMSPPTMSSNLALPPPISGTSSQVCIDLMLILDSGVDETTIGFTIMVKVMEAVSRAEKTTIRFLQEQPAAADDQIDSVTKSLDMQLRSHVELLLRYGRDMRRTKAAFFHVFTDVHFHALLTEPRFEGFR